MSSQTRSNKKKAEKRARRAATKRKEATKERQRRMEAPKRALNRPDFVFKDYDQDAVDPEFVKQVKEILSTIRFNDRTMFTEKQELIFKKARKVGSKNMINLLERLKWEITDGVELEVWFFSHLGNLVFRELNNRGELKKYIPYNEVTIIPSGSEYVVQFNAMHQKSTPHGVAYFSPLRPTIEINGKKLVIAFTRHAIERICDRSVGNWTSYEGSIDATAFLIRCRRFDVVDNHRTRKGQLCFTFYDLCREGFFTYAYVRHVLNHLSIGGPYYHRVGYCPIGIDGDLAVGITMLTPGMNGTPEHDLIQASDLPKEQKIHYMDLVNDSSMKLKFVKHPDFSAVKWFNDNGIPQVVELVEDPFGYSSSLRSQRVQPLVMEAGKGVPLEGAKPTNPLDTGEKWCCVAVSLP